MPELNKANRQVCDVDIRILKGMVPFLNFETANTTTAGLSADSVYAKAKGTRRIAFTNPMEGTMSLEAQVYPMKLFALFTDGVIEDSAAYAEVQTVKATTAGSVDINANGGTVVAGTVFVYPEDSYGDASTVIEGSFSGNKFTATSTEKIAEGKSYKVGYIVNRTGVKKITFNNKKVPNDYYVTMKTVDKAEDGTFAAFVMTAYKASIKRNFELSFSSEGDPASVKVEFDLMEDKDGNFFDMIEVSDDEE